MYVCIDARVYNIARADALDCLALADHILLLFSLLFSFRPDTAQMPPFKTLDLHATQLSVPIVSDASLISI